MKTTRCDESHRADFSEIQTVYFQNSSLVLEATKKFSARKFWWFRAEKHVYVVSGSGFVVLMPTDSRAQFSETRSESALS